MGAEARCKATINGRKAEGKALLETHDLIFRGDGERLAIKLAEIRGLEATDGVLEVRFPGGSARFELGNVADKWLKDKESSGREGLVDGQ